MNETIKFFNAILISDRFFKLHSEINATSDSSNSLKLNLNDSFSFGEKFRNLKIGSASEINATAVSFYENFFKQFKTDFNKLENINRL